MSIKSTEMLTRKRAEEMYVEKKLELERRFYKRMAENYSNQTLEDILEELDEDDDNPFTNYKIIDDESEDKDTTFKYKI